MDFRFSLLEEYGVKCSPDAVRIGIVAVVSSFQKPMPTTVDIHASSDWVRGWIAVETTAHEPP
jgi:hypothetical protein